MNARKRLERLEASRDASREAARGPERQALEDYFAVLEWEEESTRRQDAGLPSRSPPECVTRLKSDPELAGYFAKLEEHKRQREERIWHVET